jgi:hypothetical protein
MAALAAGIYSRIHFFATEADFSGIINPWKMISMNLIICLIFSIRYYLFSIILKKKEVAESR